MVSCRLSWDTEAWGDWVCFILIFSILFIIYSETQVAAYTVMHADYFTQMFHTGENVSDLQSSVTTSAN